jgi:hypothetical protein
MLLDLRAPAASHRPRLDGAPPHLFAQALGTWRARMKNEYGSHRVFLALASQLERAGFDAEEVQACYEFAEEEKHHGVLCGAVVESLGGRAEVELADAEHFPEHPDAPPRAAALRNVIHICCLSESVAVALIGAERLEMMEGSELHSLLTTIYSDEVGHARFGWKLLERYGATLSDQERAAIERYLPTAFAHVIKHELSHLPDVPSPEGGACLGLCSGHDARELLFETIERVIRPGLRRYFEC